MAHLSFYDLKVVMHAFYTIDVQLLNEYFSAANGDLFSFDLENFIWTNLSAVSFGTPPAARYCHGFTSMSGKLYVQGGSMTKGKNLAEYKYPMAEF